MEGLNEDEFEVDGSKVIYITPTYPLGLAAAWS